MSCAWADAAVTLALTTLGLFWTQLGMPRDTERPRLGDMAKSVCARQHHQG